MVWNVDYEKEYRRRIKVVEALRNKEVMPHIIKTWSVEPWTFIGDVGMTSDPRNAGTDKPTDMPFVLFPRQVEYVKWLYAHWTGNCSGLCEKTRDAGVTWLSVGFAVWAIMFHRSCHVGFGSRKEDLVDKRSDASCIFEKIRYFISKLPAEIRPDIVDKHMTIQNKANGSSVVGEAGNSIGRGGRTKVYFKDEAAHYESPETIEASLLANTDIQIDFSSVNGAGNVFHRKRFSLPEDDVFIFRWQDDPRKDQEWYNRVRALMERQGLMHIFFQEYERDYNACKRNIVIRPEWVDAAVDLHRKLYLMCMNDFNNGKSVTGLDTADDGNDSWAYCNRSGIFVNKFEDLGIGDASQMVTKFCMTTGADSSEVKYDSVGVGAGVKATVKERGISDRYNPYNGSNAVAFPDKEYVEGKTNREMFYNKKAQDWWGLRDRFHKAYRALMYDDIFDDDELICIFSTAGDIDKLREELCQATYVTRSGKILIEKAPKGAKSPNIADSVVVCFSEEEYYVQRFDKHISGLY